MIYWFVKYTTVCMAALWYGVKPKFHLARHVTSRHDTLSSPCILA